MIEGRSWMEQAAGVWRGTPAGKYWMGDARWEKMGSVNTVTPAISTKHVEWPIQVKRIRSRSCGDDEEDEFEERLRGTGPMTDLCWYCCWWNLWRDDVFHHGNRMDGMKLFHPNSRQVRCKRCTRQSHTYCNDLTPLVDSDIHGLTNRSPSRDVNGYPSASNQSAWEYSVSVTVWMSDGADAMEADEVVVVTWVELCCWNRDGCCVRRWKEDMWRVYICFIFSCHRRAVTRPCSRQRLATARLSLWNCVAAVAVREE